ncbi:LuxR C-terminal-related transcriptional regulator, partial [Streptococcus pyogenes]
HLLAEIADLLDISPKKVSAQKRSVMNKFGLHSNAELVVFVTYWQKSESIRRLVPSALPVQKGVNPPRKRRNGGSFLYPQIFSP